jgi:hypothetical protein
MLAKAPTVLWKYRRILTEFCPSFNDAVIESTVILIFD